MGHKVGIVGATGAVGSELLALLEMRNFPVSELRLLASSRSAGKKVEALGIRIEDKLDRARTPIAH